MGGDQLSVSEEEYPESYIFAADLVLDFTSTSTQLRQRALPATTFCSLLPLAQICGACQRSDDTSRPPCQAGSGAAWSTLAYTPPSTHDGCQAQVQHLASLRRVMRPSRRTRNLSKKYGRRPFLVDPPERVPNHKLPAMSDPTSYGVLEGLEDQLYTCTNSFPCSQDVV
jgi:hypothetical protein